MKVIVAGSRTVDDARPIVEAIHASGFDITEVVSGGARGVDHYGELWATLHRVPLRVFPAPWLILGKKAGFMRNAAMAKYADALIAVWDGKSKGTRHMIEEAKRQGLQVYVHRI